MVNDLFVDSLIQELGELKFNYLKLLAEFKVLQSERLQERETPVQKPKE